jgi:hypothetical protein
MGYLKNLLTASFSIIFGILLSIFVFRVFLFSFIPQKTEQLIDQWEFEASYPILELPASMPKSSKSILLQFYPNSTGIIGENYPFNWHFNRWTGQLHIKSQTLLDQRFDGCYDMVIQHGQNHILLLLDGKKKKIQASKAAKP